MDKQGGPFMKAFWAMLHIVQDQMIGSLEILKSYPGRVKSTLHCRTSS